LVDLVTRLAGARICTRLAAPGGVARLGAIAKHPVVAQVVGRRVVTRVRGLVARIRGAGDAIVAVDGRPNPTSSRWVARFDAIAIQPVVTLQIIRQVLTRAKRLVARIHRAANAVIAIHWRTGLAA